MGSPCWQWPGCPRCWPRSTGCSAPLSRVAEVVVAGLAAQPVAAVAPSTPVDGLGASAVLAYLAVPVTVPRCAAASARARAARGAAATLLVSAALTEVDGGRQSASWATSRPARSG